MEALTDKSHMPIGKYIGYCMQDVPASYLLWFADNVPRTIVNDPIHDYVEDNKQALLNEQRWSTE